MELSKLGFSSSLSKTDEKIARSDFPHSPGMTHDLAGFFLKLHAGHWGGNR